MGEFHYVPLRLLFKMANESRFLELTVELAWRRKTLGRKVSGVGKVMVNSLFFFFFTGKTGGDQIVAGSGRLQEDSLLKVNAASTAVSYPKCTGLQDGEEEINVEQQVGVISLEMGLGLGAAV